MLNNTYIEKGFHEWGEGWKKNSFRLSKGKVLVNEELWKKLFYLKKIREVDNDLFVYITK